MLVYILVLYVVISYVLIGYFLYQSVKEDGIRGTDILLFVGSPVTLLILVGVAIKLWNDDRKTTTLNSEFPRRPWEE